MRAIATATSFLALAGHRSAGGAKKAARETGGKQHETGGKQHETGALIELIEHDVGTAS